MRNSGRLCSGFQNFTIVTHQPTDRGRGRDHKLGVAGNPATSTKLGALQLLPGLAERRRLFGPPSHLDVRDLLALLDRQYREAEHRQGVDLGNRKLDDMLVEFAEGPVA